MASKTKQREQAVKAATDGELVAWADQMIRDLKTERNPMVRASLSKQLEIVSREQRRRMPS